MVDDAYKVKLIEVNSSPAVAEQLLPQMTADLKELQIDEKLTAISDDWSDEQLTFANFKNRGMICLKGGETGELIEKGEETLMALGNGCNGCNGCNRPARCLPLP